MLFGPLPFDDMNEADVRADVLDPLVRALGYRKGSEFEVVRELSLRYPKVFLGRKDLKKDPVLRGKADYMLEVRSLLRWVLEAKSPSGPITIDDVEQAYTYAAHPEVRAEYFVLSNGRTLQIFRTRDSPTVGPLISVDYDELDAKLATLTNVLGPAAMERDCVPVVADLGVPLGPGLRSVERLLGGEIRYLVSSVPDPMLRELLVSVSDGGVERNEDGQLVAFLRTRVGMRSFQELNERLGLDAFEMVSDDSKLSDDPQHPTVLSYSASFTFPKGEKFLNFATWQERHLPFEMQIAVSAIACGHLEDGRFVGKFTSELTPTAPGVKMPAVKLEGAFWVAVGHRSTRIARMDSGQS